EIYTLPLHDALPTGWGGGRRTQPWSLARAMPRNRDRPLDRERVMPLVSMAALSIRLVPGRWEFAWHQVSQELQRSLEMTCVRGLSRQRSSMNPAMASLLI